MRNGLVAILAGAGMAVFATEAAAAEPTQVERVQAALNDWLAARAPENVTGIAAYISFGDTGPAIEAFAGMAGRSPARDGLARFSTRQTAPRSRREEIENRLGS